MYKSVLKNIRRWTQSGSHGSLVKVSGKGMQPF